MNRYLLDSDIIIDFFAKKEPGYSILKDLETKKLAISVITFIELVYGLKKKEGSHKRIKEFKTFLQDGRIRSISLNEKIADVFTDQKIYLEKRGEKLADFDLIIASTALLKNLILVTRNKKHFERIRNLKLF